MYTNCKYVLFDFKNFISGDSFFLSAARMYQMDRQQFRNV